jgi:hypothetical protein
MRPETMNASGYLAWRLHHAANIAHVQDDGDLLLVTLHSGEQVLIYLIERPIPLADIQHYYQTNTAQGRYTLLFFQVALMLPENNDLFSPPAWMHLLLTLQHGKIYAYEGQGKDTCYLFPVYFEGAGHTRRIRYGEIIDYDGLRCLTVPSDHPALVGTWHTATFETVGRQQWGHQVPIQDGDLLAFYYRVLGLTADASLEQVRKAIRQLARQYHPDINTNLEAHFRMKQLNDAYHRILAHRETR